MDCGNFDGAAAKALGTIISDFHKHLDSSNYINHSDLKYILPNVFTFLLHLLICDTNGRFPLRVGSDVLYLNYMFTSINHMLYSMKPTNDFLFNVAILDTLIRVLVVGSLGYFVVELLRY